jgi:hypothetical protein
MVLRSSSKTTAYRHFQRCLLRDTVHREPSTIFIWLASIEVRTHYIQRCSIDIIFIQNHGKGMVILRAPLSDLCASILATARHTPLEWFIENSHCPLSGACGWSHGSCTRYSIGFKSALPKPIPDFSIEDYVCTHHLTRCRRSILKSCPFSLATLFLLSIRYTPWCCRVSYRER